MPSAQRGGPAVRVVADTNVLVSGLLWPGASASFLDAAARRLFHLLTSHDLMEELEEVLSRPHLLARLRARDRTVEEVMSKQQVLATVVTPAMLPLPLELRDRADLPVLQCAIGGDAHAIVTGDKDLLTLKEFQGVIIVTPRAFLATIGM